MSNFTLALDIPPGLNSDDTTFGAKGRWAAGNNVRWRNGRPEVIGHIAHLLDDATDTAPNARTMFAYTVTGTAIPLIVVGADAALLCNNGGIGSMADISPTGLGSGILGWALDTFGDTLLAAPRGGALYARPGASGNAAIVSAAPANMNHMLVTAQRQVMAIGANEVVSGTQNLMCIRLSDIEDYTSWTPTSTNNADEIILEGEGKLVGGYRVSSYVAILSSGSLWLGQYVGDPGQSYRFDKIASGCGLVGPAAATTAAGVLYWMSTDHRFYRWMPGTLPEQIPCPISRDIQTNISTGTSRLDTRTIAVRNPAFNELWWFYPDTRAGAGVFRWVAYNYVENFWTQGDLDRRAAYNADFLYNPALNANTRTWTPFISVDGNGYLYSHDAQGSGIGGGDPVVSWSLSTADQYMNEARERVMIERIIPDFKEQTGDVTLTLSLRDWPQGAVTTKTYTLTAGAKKKDFRASGKIVSATFSGTGAMRLGRPSFDCVTMGER